MLRFPHLRPQPLPCPYFDSERRHQLVAVGWLNEAQLYLLCDIRAPFLDRLFDLLAKS